MKTTIILFGLVIFIIIAVTIVTVVVCMKMSKNKDRRAPKERCTVKTTGTFLYAHSVHSTFTDSHGETTYNYYPVVRYQYNGQMYESESKQANSFWELATKNIPVDVFVNPENAEDVYVPLPEVVLERYQKRNKFLLTCLLIYFVIAGGVMLLKYLLK